MCVQVFEEPHSHTHLRHGQGAHQRRWSIPLGAPAPARASFPASPRAQHTLPVFLPQTTCRPTPPDHTEPTGSECCAKKDFGSVTTPTSNCLRFPAMRYSWWHLTEEDGKKRKPGHQGNAVPAGLDQQGMLGGRYSHLNSEREGLLCRPVRRAIPSHRIHPCV